MKPLKEYTIPFIGLKLGLHHYNFKIEKTFFEYFEYDDFNDADVNVDVALLKNTTLLELNFKIRGWVNINCDLTNEAYNQTIENEFDFRIDIFIIFNFRKTKFRTIKSWF